MPWALSTATLSILWPIIDSIYVTFGQICNFRDLNLVTFCFFLIDPFLNGMKNTLFFTYSTNILTRFGNQKMKNCLAPKNPKMCDPILVTLLRMPYKQIPPPPRVYVKMFRNLRALNRNRTHDRPVGGSCDEEVGSLGTLDLSYRYHKTKVLIFLILFIHITSDMQLA